ncbi:hypothetical protein CEUSTIGMA_g10780.t1 [Chlamydomonas eustigma]|uniref:Signal recognition particle 19 kDa protein n=1 Tax=Chlamydomonas eustigma TaxID=1157962 RepID=A0A250XJU0_9CHLO|nr:hypothetical protein CEUSTIGMA_g10780.t1 [Chlamydomonas eustigma]|eukprot:GAX83355.1 hypothetical protein CEUSTIGMA_g10780.t1 [Chlamydomonas eustigma]
MSFTYDKRIIVYPHYITAGKTVAEGRRLPKELACADPNVLDMSESCKELNIPHIIEDKHYPRDWFIRCRLRVELKRPDGSFYNPEITNRRSLLIKIAQLVSKHKSKNPVPTFSGIPSPTAALPVPAAADGASAASSSAASSKGNNKKKKGR